MTAKPSKEDFEWVPHHLFDYVNVDWLDYTVVEYLNDFENCLAQIETDKIPILVGGTNYYIERAVFENA